MKNSIHFEQAINQIYNHLYANAPVRTPNGIAKEAGKILRTISYIQEKNKYEEFNHISERDLKSNDDVIVSVLGKKFRTYFNEMNGLYKIYSSQEKIDISDFDILYVVKKIGSLQLNNHNHDFFGDAAEIFRSNWVKSHGGQFFTDQRVTKLAIDLLEFNPLKGDDLVDICAGTGGFLLAGLNKIKEISKSNDTSFIKKIALKSIKGQEIDPDLCEIGNATLSYRLGGEKINIIQRGDSIVANNFKSGDLRFNSHSCVVTNPPFGSKITIKDNNTLREFELSQIPSSSFNATLIKTTRLIARSPDILFLEQNVKLLKSGSGRLAIVLPYQIVSGPQTYFVREWLLRNAQIVAVIDLPPETFQPHTGTKASLVILKRREKPLEKVDTKNDPTIFMARPKWIGHDRRGNPVYKRSIDGAYTDEILSDFPEVGIAFNDFKIGKDPRQSYNYCYAISASTLVEDPSLRLDAQFHDSNKKNQQKSLQFKNKKDWRFIKISDVTERIFYPGRFRRDYTEDKKNSVLFLGGTNISQLIADTDKRLSADNPNLEQLTVKNGWILITRSGSVGIVATVPKAWEGYAISEHVIRIIPNSKKLSPEYLYAFLKTNYAQTALSRGIYGSVIDEITPDFIGSIEIPIPSSRNMMDRIVKDIRLAEESRDSAINGFSSTISYLDNFLRS